MRGLPSEKALVTAYWRKLARSNESVRKNPGSVFAESSARRLRSRESRLSHPRYSVAGGGTRG
jgi:hypothetical protein